MQLRRLCSMSKRRPLLLISVCPILFVCIQNYRLIPENKKDISPFISISLTVTGEQTEKSIVTFDPSIPTVAFHTQHWGGFRNLVFIFTAFVMKARTLNFTQILLPSLTWNAAYASEIYVEHEILFDISHWNSFYPLLPRLVPYDPMAHDQYDVQSHNITVQAENATRPHAIFPKTSWFWDYKIYAMEVSESHYHVRNPVDELIRGGGALRPSYGLQTIMTNILESHDTFNHTYIALHARIEPDMQKHSSCREIYEGNLTKIFQLLEDHFIHPPAQSLFIAINRPALESEAVIPTTPIENRTREEKLAALAAENLVALNNAIDYGLFGGTVKVFEGGVATVVNTSIFKGFPDISGAIIDFYLAIEASIFIGTPVSSFSSDIVATRFYEDRSKKNYFYDGQKLWNATTTMTLKPPPFVC